jgi:uncharacterized protein (TIGR03086 family)
MPADPIDQLAVAADVTGEIIAAVRADQWTAPTPCAGWTVSDLTAHVTGGNHLFASALRGEPPQPAAAGPDQDWPQAYQASVPGLLSAFRAPGALEKQVTVPFGTVPGTVALHLRITELLVHGWDLARATGQQPTFPAGLAEQELAFSQRALGELPPGRSPFAPPQPAGDDAPAIDRLAACLGRAVT